MPKPTENPGKGNTKKDVEVIVAASRDKAPDVAVSVVVDFGSLTQMVDDGSVATFAAAVVALKSAMKDAEKASSEDSD